MHIMDLITSAPLWLQAPLVVAVSVLLCGVLAFLLLRVIDVVGGHTHRWFEGKNEE
ncbi:hypothetical protein [Corynebacterium sp. H130]|uniref:hypothetical protein n=1 Tax=Corynebacterium sp. H130 TaxID=3133444 RepID=UPI0030AA9124